MKKIAYLCVPFVGGTYTRFINLRPRIKSYGYDFRCIDLQQSAGCTSASEHLDDGVERWLLPINLGDYVKNFIDRLQREGYSAVVSLPLGSQAKMAAVPYLPANIASIILVPGMTRTIYEFTAFLAQYSDSVIAVSERVASDLINRGYVDNNRVTTIFNGVDTTRFAPLGELKPKQAPLRVIYLGRLEDSEKGVLLLPRIVRRALASGCSLELDVVGKGADSERLVKAVKRAGVCDHVRMLGDINHTECEQILKGYDCLVMPSRTEACPNAMLEAMACGVVPVASRIWGSIGTIVEDEKSGLLACVGDIGQFASHLVRLNENRSLLHRMRRECIERVREHFTLDVMATAYSAVFKRALDDRGTCQRLGDSAVALPPELRRRWRSRLPIGMKVLVRNWITRFGGTA